MSAIVSKTSAMDLKAEDAASGTSGAPITFRISSSAVDKAKDTLNVNGWSLDEWNTNPVVLWMHDNYSPPVARGVKAWVEGGFLKSQAVFASAVYPLAATIEGLIRGDFLRAASVGFVSDDYSPNESGGLDFKTQTLREWSVVTIGCNGDALVEAKSAGIDTEPLREWAHHTLERLDGSGVWIPKAEAETLIKTLGGIKTFSIPAPSASTENTMKTLTLIVQVPEAKVDEAKADVEKKIKNHGGALLKSESADAANDDMASHIKAFGKLLDQHAKALETQGAHIKDMGGYCADLGKHVKALKDAADGDGDGDKKNATDTVTKGAAHKLSASQLKSVKSIAKAASEIQARHHDSQGAADGEPDGDEDKPSDEDKAAAEAKQKALEAKLTALMKDIDTQKMRLTGKVS